jgi:surface antigen
MSALRLIGHRRLAPIAAVLLAFAGSGCSMSYQLGALFEREKPPESTGTIGAAPEVVAMPEADKALRAAASEALARGEQNASVPWENPATGARGTVTPLAAAYSHAGRTCRDFLASYVRGGAESWLQGEACRGEEGHWEVRSLKPWTRS